MKIIATAATTVIVAYLLWRFSGDSGLFEILKNINPVIVVLAFFLYILNLVAKTLRFRFVLRNKISLKKLLSIVSIHSFWNNILPFRSGEITYLYMVNEEKNISNGENVTSLVLARVFDLLIVLTFFLISGFFIFRQNPSFLASTPLTFIVSILISGVVILWGIVFYRHELSRFFSGLSFKNSFLNKFSRIMAETFLALEQIKNFKRLAILATLSLFVWVLDTLFVLVILLSAGFDFSLIEAAFIGVFPALASLIPINLIGNFGAFEGTVAGGLVLLSVSIEDAFNLSFILHIQIILFSFLFFVWAFWYRNFFGKRTFDYQAKTHTEFYSNLNNPEEDFRNNNLADFVLNFLRKGNLLDIGAGLGLLVSKALQKNIEVKGIEPDKKLVDLSEKFFGKLDINQVSIEQYDSQKRFDNIIMIDVLECLEDYKKNLIKAISLLNKEGRLILVVPALPSLYGSRDKMMGYFRRFSKKELSRELEDLGLKIIKVRYWNMLGVLPYWILYKVLKRESHFESIRGGKNKKGIFFKVLNFWFKYIENKINLGFGLSLIFVVEKSDQTM
ncbi:MAG: flippase-like domain-containing protein [bacterium]|nr:flippase-like domain-containing protein [bacterium]